MFRPGSCLEVGWMGTKTPELFLLYIVRHLPKFPYAPGFVLYQLLLGLSREVDERKAMDRGSSWEETFSFNSGLSFRALGSGWWLGSGVGTEMRVWGSCPVLGLPRVILSPIQDWLERGRDFYHISWCIWSHGRTEKASSMIPSEALWGISSFLRAPHMAVAPETVKSKMEPSIPMWT